MMLLSLWKRSTTSLTLLPWSKDTNEMSLLCKARVTTEPRQRMHLAAPNDSCAHCSSCLTSWRR
jgi:hypothetical protein